MRLFRRRAKGRHALGAAVTSLPSGPAVAAPAVPALPAQVAPAHDTWTHDAAAVPAPGRQHGDLPRVQLGFRDGSCQSLDPTSEDALALGGLAEALTRRD